MSVRTSKRISELSLGRVDIRVLRLLEGYERSLYDHSIVPELMPHLQFGSMAYVASDVWMNQFADQKYEMRVTDLLTEKGTNN